ncbi:hypothetical protein FS749_014615 [Ceratobasidium sp. UAMH 11750]|nr:hypothetical protein FS749_014615 [Ceratobasidium sp. UAMH 11750]
MAQRRHQLIRCHIKKMPSRGSTSIEVPAAPGNDAEAQLLEAEDRARQLEEQLQEAQAENARLKAAADGDREREQAPPRAENTPAFSDDEIKVVKAAGRRCCVLHLMWMKGDCLFDTDVRNDFDAIIANLEALRGEGSDDDTEDAAATFWHTTRFGIADPEIGNPLPTPSRCLCVSARLTRRA